MEKAQRKRCTKCGKVKALDEFHRWSHSPDGRACQCRLCDKARKQERYTDPDFRAREAARNRALRARPEVAAKVRARLVKLREDPKWRAAANARYRAWYSDPDTRVRRLARGAHRRARALGIPFDKDLSDLLPAPTHCPALGVPLNYSAQPGKGGQRFFSPSIDRIDPKGGYVKGNRIIVSLLANTIKTNATPDQIRKVADFYSRLSAAKSGGS